MNDRQLVLDTIEEICADTKNIDEVCMALEHSTIFATEMIQDLIKEIDKYKNVIDKIKELVENNTELYKHDMDLTDYRTTMNTSGFIKALLELLEEVE